MKCVPGEVIPPKHVLALTRVWFPLYMFSADDVVGAQFMRALWWQDQLQACRPHELEAGFDVL